MIESERDGSSEEKLIIALITTDLQLAAQSGLETPLVQIAAGPALFYGPRRR